MNKSEIIKLMQKESITSQELLIFINERIADEGRGYIDWNRIHPTMLSLAIQSEQFRIAYRNCKEYFEHKWHLTKLDTGKKMIYIDSWEGNIYY